MIATRDGRGEARGPFTSSPWPSQRSWSNAQTEWPRACAVRATNPTRNQHSRYLFATGTYLLQPGAEFAEKVGDPWSVNRCP